MPLRPEVQLVEDQKRMLQALRGGEPRSRIDLSRQLDINNGVVTRLSRELISLGLVAEAEAQASARGRPSLPLHLRGDGAYAVGAATHPGWVDICAIDFAGTPLAQKSYRWDEGEPRQFAETLASEVDALIAPLRLRHARFLGFGVSVPGFTTGSPVKRHTVERMHKWRDQDLSALLGEVLDGPVWIENDANAAAIAEYYQRGLAGGTSLLVIYLGHGVGGSCISGGQLLLGEYGNAGEIGILYPLDQPRPSAVDLAGSLQEASAEAVDLFNLADHIAAQAAALDTWIVRAAQQLELAALTGIAWFDPADIVISGTLPGPVLEQVTDRLRAVRWDQRMGVRPAPGFHASTLQGRAAAIGAAFLPIHHLIAPERTAKA